MSRQAKEKHEEASDKPSEEKKQPASKSQRAKGLTTSASGKDKRAASSTPVTNGRLSTEDPSISREDAKNSGKQIPGEVIKENLSKPSPGLVSPTFHTAATPKGDVFDAKQATKHDDGGLKKKDGKLGKQRDSSPTFDFDEIVVAPEIGSKKTKKVRIARAEEGESRGETVTTPKTSKKKSKKVLKNRAEDDDIREVINVATPREQRASRKSGPSKRQPTPQVNEGQAEVQKGEGSVQEVDATVSSTPNRAPPVIFNDSLTSIQQPASEKRKRLQPQEDDDVPVGKAQKTTRAGTKGVYSSSLRSTQSKPGPFQTSK